MKTLPENIAYVQNDEAMTRPASGFIAMIVKNGKVKDYTPEDGEKVLAADVVKNLLLQNFRTKKGESYELPDEMSAYSAANDLCQAVVEGHREAEELTSNAKEAEKEKKLAEKKAAAEAKELEDKQFQEAGNEFEEMFMKKAENLKKKQSQQVEAMLLTVSSGLGKNVTLANNGLGVAVAENASRADIAAATAAVINGMEGLAAMQGALQFSVGDLINGAVKNGAYRTKGDACDAIKHTVKDKLQRNFNVGTLNYYATMAERVTVDNRKAGISPSLYLEASKLTAPRLKDSKPSDQIELEKSVVEARNDIISQINSGEIKSIKDAKDKIDAFKTEKGLKKDAAVPASYYFKRLFFAQWIKRNLLGDKDSVTVQIDTKSTKTYTRAELTDIEEDAINNLQPMFIKQKLESLIAGFVTKGKGEKTEKIPYLLDNPFEVEVEKEEAPSGEAPKVEEEDNGDPENTPE